MLVIGAVIGTLLSGPLTDLLMRSGHISGPGLGPGRLQHRCRDSLLIPGFLDRQPGHRAAVRFVGTALISAANPPLDAARLDIMPPGLWGRAESVRTFLRSLAQALAPLLFGGVSDLIAGFEPQKAPIGTHTVGPVSTATGDGLQITFLIMLVSLLAAGWFLWRARLTYPGDVATAGASVSPKRSADDDRGRAADEGTAEPAAAGPRPDVDPAEAETRVTRRRTSSRLADPASSSPPPGTTPASPQSPQSPPPRRSPSPESPPPRRSPSPDSPPQTERVTDPSEDATEPLVRRRRPAPEWLPDRDSAPDGDATEPLVWPRDAPPDS